MSCEVLKMHSKIRTLMKEPDLWILWGISNMQRISNKVCSFHSAESWDLSLTQRKKFENIVVSKIFLPTLMICNLLLKLLDNIEILYDLHTEFRKIPSDFHWIFKLSRLFTIKILKIIFQSAAFCDITKTNDTSESGLYIVLPMVFAQTQKYYYNKLDPPSYAVFY